MRWFSLCGNPVHAGHHLVWCLLYPCWYISYRIQEVSVIAHACMLTAVISRCAFSSRVFKQYSVCVCIHVDPHKLSPFTLCALGIKLSSSGVVSGTLICWIFSPAQIETRLPHRCKPKAVKKGDCYFLSASLKKWGEYGVQFVQTH